MSLSRTPSLPHFRLPTNLIESTSVPKSTFQAPLQDLFEGEWYMIRSSCSFWKDKRNVRLKYTSASSHIDDRASYQTVTSDAIKCMDGRDTPSDSETGIFTWQGKGLLRVASARWEVLCFTSRPNTGDWMLVYTHKSIFTSPSVNLMCRNKVGISSSDLSHIEYWLRGVSDGRFQQEVNAMVDIIQQ
ncbi:hypothetical protein P280DRAFT_454449 [Massarina eburnea CBS 473.64]|uniref:Calycin-like protein n=1 Tax=Massarina eburnea CBS 473.64 TaxID=1395130 RepID=A0A6A6RW70_9PLEO|nr:hypothetical protein P280DRAFT_454449 [Massarina eburnea CBS 473.64]